MEVDLTLNTIMMLVGAIVTTGVACLIVAEWPFSKCERSSALDIPCPVEERREQEITRLIQR